MSSHIETIREWFSLVERKDNQAIGERFVGEGYTWIDHTNGVVATTQEQLEAAMVEDSQLSDRKYVIKEAFETTDGAVIVLLSITDTLTGEWRGIKGTGQQVHREMCDIFRFDTDGRVISEEAYEDALSIMRQLGAVSI